MKAIGLVVKEKDVAFITGRLRAIQQERHFDMYIYPESPVFPGRPYTVEELDKLLDEAEKGPSFSVEEANAYLEMRRKSTSAHES